MPKRLNDKALVKAKSTALTTADYEEEMAKYAKEAAESEPLPAGQFASLKNGLYVGGNRMKDDQMDVVVLGSVRENSYYAGKYDPEEKNPPTCWAFGTKDEDMRPAAEALGYWDTEEGKFTKPESCVGCPMNEWGSADTGKGKRCQNRRRLAFISANGVDDPDYVENTEVVQLKIPVTSVRAWNGYVHHVAESGYHPAYVTTNLARVVDEDSLFKVNFTMGEVLAKDLLPIISARRETVARLITQPYPTITEEDAVAMVKGKGKKAAAKNGKAKY